jgi:hypothetical protein
MGKVCYCIGWRMSLLNGLILTRRQRVQSRQRIRVPAHKQH